MLFKYVNDDLDVCYINTDQITTVRVHIPEKKVIVNYLSYSDSNKLSLGFNDKDEMNGFIERLEKAMN